MAGFKFARKTYPNKDIYEGEFVDGQREGRGTLFYVNGDRYTGEFNNGLFEGFGLYSYAPFVEKGKVIRSRRYEGFYLKGQRHGHGLSFWAMVTPTTETSRTGCTVGMVS